MSESKIFDQYKSEVTLEEVVEEHDLQPLSLEVYRSDRVDDLWSLTKRGFEPLAWTPYVRYLLYNKDRGILIHDVEGDLYIWKDPTEETIRDRVQEYPKAEVSIGEKYDSRFDRRCGE